MFPDIQPGATYATRLIHELGRKYVRDLNEFWLALHGFYRLKQTASSHMVDIDTCRKRDVRLARELREFVDAWLASGHINGHEYPYRRQIPLDRIPRLNQFLREQPTGAGPYLFQQAGILPTPVGDYPELDDTTNRHRPIRQIALDRKHKAESTKNLSALHMGIEISYPLWQSEMWEQNAADEALRLFLTLLHTGGMRFLLVQCHKCSRYDFTATLQRGYKRGWHCPDCRQAASSAASVQKSRDALQQKRMRLAVKARRKYRSAYGELAVWLAEQINSSLPPEQWIKRNWVTPKLDKIEDEAGM